MSATGLDVVDTTVQKTMGWLKDIMDELGWSDRHRAYLAMRASLHQVRDRLSTDQVAHLGAQLPMLVRGIYYEGWDPGLQPGRDRTAEEFIAALIDYFPSEPDLDYKVVMIASLAVLSRHVDPGIIRHVRASMPDSIRRLWPAEAAVT
jgi:uncharacterized protein (DUF2267 family)